MERPLIILKPSIVNAIIPILIKNLIIASVIVFILYVISKFINYPISAIWFILILIVISLLPLTVRVIILNFTKYYFFKDRAISEFKFIRIKTHSVIYEKITDIKVTISLWDRLCKAGDIILHTAENNVPDLTLKYIENPREIERGIYNLLKR